MSYSGGDGQSLGIVLTPKHITELFCDLANIKPTDKVFDPCCGTAGFLIASMHKMVKLAGDDEVQIRRIKKEQLFGIELQAYMYTIATTNMILRGDGNSNLHNWDFLKQNPAQLQLKGYTVGMMNPPYSQGTKADPSLYEINFTEHLLDSLTEGAKAVVIIPQSSVTGKTKEEQAIKENILKNHTLEGVITLHKDTFYGVGVNTCIAVFTAHIPHNKKHICKFINFEDDGFVVAKHVGLIETQSAKDKRQHLLDVWFDRTEAETRFCVKTTIEAEDEWLHSFYYFNDEIPSEKDFENTMADYLTFEFNMMTHGRGYLLKRKEAAMEKQISRTWKDFYLHDFFSCEKGNQNNMASLTEGSIPLVSARKIDNGYKDFVSPNNKKLFPGHILTLNNDGDGGAGIAYYQPHVMALDSHVTALVPKLPLSRYQLLFVAMCITKQRNRFGHGYSINTNRLRSFRIMLPCVEATETPDWQYMDIYMKDKEQELLKPTIEQLCKRLINSAIGGG